MKNYCLSTLLTLLLAAVTLRAEVLLDVNGKPVRYAGNFSASPVNLPAPKVKRQEVRAVWVATVENIDFGPFADGATFRKQAAALMRSIRNANFNTVFFQVRSNCDAWYPSQLNPYSRYLTGKEGRGIPGIDPLKILIEEAHRNNLEFHAWFNPYRVVGSTKLTKNRYLATLDGRNFARRNPDLVLSVVREDKTNTLFLNPGEPAVRRHIVSSIMEVVRNYPVDAIHFDDYFYPYDDIAFADEATFKNFRRKGENDIHQWRRNNVSIVIQWIRNELNKINNVRKRKVVFGISPFGIWANKSKNMPLGSLTKGKECFSVLHADVRTWIKLELIDYVVPQLYWGFASGDAAYAALADWWAAQVRGTKVRLFTGHAVYRLGSNPTFPENEIFNQLRYNQSLPEVTGFALFSARRFFRPDNRKMQNGVGKIKFFLQEPATPGKYR